jgi:hypothetical protein
MAKCESRCTAGFVLAFKHERVCRRHTAFSDVAWLDVSLGSAWGRASTVHDNDINGGHDLDFDREH